MNLIEILTDNQIKLIEYADDLEDRIKILENRNRYLESKIEKITKDDFEEGLFSNVSVKFTDNNKPEDIPHY